MKLSSNLVLLAILFFILSVINVTIAFAFLSNFTFDLDFSPRYSKVFIDMWKHLTSGSVEVTPANIAGEGFMVNGKVIAYFLPLPAIVRGALNIIGLGNSAIASMLFASLLINFGVFLIYEFISNEILKNKSISIYAFLPSLIFPYTFLYFEASVFWESILWSVALFNLFIFGILINLKKNLVSYKILLGFLSIFILFTRPTYIVASILALFLLACRDIWLNKFDYKNLYIFVPFILAMACLMHLNYLRWGGIFEFSPMQYHDQFINNPARILKYYDINSFSINRIPSALRYYFGFGWNNFQSQFPFFKMDAPFSMHDTPSYDYIEKRLSIFLTLPFLAIFSIYGGFRAYKLNKDLFYLIVVTFIPFLLICCIFSMTLRYRSEILTFFILSSSVGLISYSSRLSLKKVMLVSVPMNFCSLILTLNSVVQERSDFFKGCLVSNPELICNILNIK